jgi:hypothetical protein
MSFTFQYGTSTFNVASLVLTLDSACRSIWADPGDYPESLNVIVSFFYYFFFALDTVIIWQLNQLENELKKGARRAYSRRRATSI